MIFLGVETFSFKNEKNEVIDVAKLHYCDERVVCNEKGLLPQSVNFSLTTDNGKAILEKLRRKSFFDDFEPRFVYGKVIKGKVSVKLEDVD